jgi:hypothetical protein
VSDRAPACETESKAAFVWISTPDTVESNTVSFLACVETLAAFGLYAYIAMNFHYLPFWWMSIIVAPLLLLRSEQSMNLAARWMNKYWNDSDDFPREIGSLAQLRIFWFLSILSIFVTFVASYVLAKYWATNYSGFALYWRAAIIGAAATLSTSSAAIAVVGPGTGPGGIATKKARARAAGRATVELRPGSGAGAVTRAVASAAPGALPIAMAATVATSVVAAGGAWELIAIAATTAAASVMLAEAIVETPAQSRSPAGVVLWTSVAVGIWARTIAIRFGATVLHPIQGLKALPQNWQRALYAMDFFHPPELIPRNPIDELTVDTFWRLIADKNEDWYFRAILALLGLFLFVPAVIYRLLIKSTCWFYLPLFYLLLERRHERADDPTEMRDRILRHPWTWIQAVMALVTLAGGIMTAASHDFGTTLKEIGNFGAISALEVLVVLDWSAIRPWQWLSLASAILTLYVIYETFNLAIDVRHLHNRRLKEVAGKRAWRMEYVWRARMFFTIPWIALLIVDIATKTPLGSHIPPRLLEPLRAFLG